MRIPGGSGRVGRMEEGLEGWFGGRWVVVKCLG